MSAGARVQAFGGHGAGLPAELRRGGLGSPAFAFLGCGELERKGGEIPGTVTRVPWVVVRLLAGRSATASLLGRHNN